VPVSCPLPPGRFLVLISVKRLSQPQGHSACSTETIHNQMCSNSVTAYNLIPNTEAKSLMKQGQSAQGFSSVHSYGCGVFTPLLASGALSVHNACHRESSSSTVLHISHRQNWRQRLLSRGCSPCTSCTRKGYSCFSCSVCQTAL
jgi:hypothetical protein